MKKIIPLLLCLMLLLCSCYENEYADYELHYYDRDDYVYDLTMDDVLEKFSTDELMEACIKKEGVVFPFEYIDEYDALDYYDGTLELAYLTDLIPFLLDERKYADLKTLVRILVESGFNKESDDARNLSEFYCFDISTKQKHRIEAILTHANVYNQVSSVPRDATGASLWEEVKSCPICYPD